MVPSLHRSKVINNTYAFEFATYASQMTWASLNSHVTRKGNAWKFVKTLHVKFFAFGQKWPTRNVTVKLRVQNTIMMIAEEIVNYNNFKIACKKFVCNYFNEFLRFPILKELKRVKG